MVHASPAHSTLDVYRQRKTQNAVYYRCVEDCFETLEQFYQERFEQKYGNPGPVYYPRIFLSGTYELPSGNRPGAIPVQRREGNQDIRRTEIAGGHVLSCAQQGRAAGTQCG